MVFALQKKEYSNHYATGNWNDKRKIFVNSRKLNHLKNNISKKEKKYTGEMKIPF